MGIVGFSLRRRVTISMCAVALMLFGIVAFSRLPINLLPDLSYPSLTVETKLPGAAPSEVESLVTRPIEETVGVVSGVTRLTSVSRPGLSQVILEFGWGQNMDFASIDVREKLDTVVVPRQAEKPVLLRFDPSNDPIARLFLTGGTDLYQLRYVAEEVLKEGPRVDRGDRCDQGLGGVRGRDSGLRRSRQAFVARPVDRRREPEADPGERQPGRRQPLRGGGALPRAGQQRVQIPRGHPRHGRLRRRRASGSGPRRRHGRTGPQEARRDHSLRRRGSGRAGDLQGG